MDNALLGRDELFDRAKSGRSVSTAAWWASVLRLNPPETRAAFLRGSAMPDVRDEIRRLLVENGVELETACESRPCAG